MPAIKSWQSLTSHSLIWRRWRHRHRWRPWWRRQQTRKTQFNSIQFSLVKSKMKALKKILWARTIDNIRTCWTLANDWWCTPSVRCNLLLFFLVLRTSAFYLPPSSHFSFCSWVLTESFSSESSSSFIVLGVWVVFFPIAPRGRTPSIASPPPPFPPLFPPLYWNNKR